MNNDRRQLQALDKSNTCTKRQEEQVKRAVKRIINRLNEHTNSSTYVAVLHPHNVESFRAMVRRSGNV